MRAYWSLAVAPAATWRCGDEVFGHRRMLAGHGDQGFVRCWFSFSDAAGQGSIQSDSKNALFGGREGLQRMPSNGSCL
ncbi:unnamed protein product [Arabidopsis thaliana]|uniref:(thale cress) hypothetical protein n=1 Tax=Arabidopsis thaliana TaxID=3702 RepID=A0A7G2EXS4_ARATH|nr:unnamed protein product [Arabidopsis thaliana]